VLEQFIAKLGSKHRRIKGAAAERFEAVAGLSPGGARGPLRAKAPAEAVAWIAAHAPVVDLLDRSTGGGAGLIISEHADTLRRSERGYGSGQKPSDYLDSFAGFLRDNMNRSRRSWW
jgi:type I restriction enzyme R subunit